MDKLHIEFENCYGIKKLDYDFDLATNDQSKGVYAIYAPNGFMKSSFADTFDDYANNRDSIDRIFPERETKRVIQFNENESFPENVMVVKPYDESYSSDQVSLLLVNEKLKKEYEGALKEINVVKADIIKALKKNSGLSGRPDPIDQTFCEDFGRESKEFFELLTELKDKYSQDEFIDFSKYVYKEIFNKNVLALIASGDIAKELEDYIQVYDSLIEKSPILSKSFNHQNADAIAKSLTSTGFFSASHTVNLKVGDEKREFLSHKELSDFIKEEQERILNDSGLEEKFQAIDKKMSNAESKKFRDYLYENRELISELKNYESLKEKLWVAYLQENAALWRSCLDTYKVSKDKIAEIVKDAKNESTIWELVVAQFNSRFDVPFTLSVSNQEDVILQESKPSVRFEFHDGRDTRDVERSTLLQALSQGEKRALYLLNILFEVEVRKRSNTHHLFIFDDVADSFDYKNKYAIVEYLRDISDSDFFRLIVLSHNFDFYRTISSRFNLGKSKRLIAIRDNYCVRFAKERYQRDVFRYWKKNFRKNQRFSLASIAFARNVAEYSGKSDQYGLLTSLLHVKPNTSQLTFRNLNSIYKDIFEDFDGELSDLDQNVVEKILEHAAAIANDDAAHVELEDKVILAIAIRLLAEKYMIRKIADPERVGSISSNQTWELYCIYTNNFLSETDAIKVLDRVNLMTPENIHLNSFMYEPILDMSARHLYQLHRDVLGLNDASDS